MNRARFVAMILALLVGSRSSVIRAEAAEPAHVAPASSTAGAPAADEEKRGYWWKREPPPDVATPAYADLPPPPSEEALLALHPKQLEKMLDDYR
ncbi:MAG: hypothetical protein ACREMY_01265, partial [bacterium]